MEKRISFCWRVCFKANTRTRQLSADERREGGTNYRRPVVRKGPTMLHMFVYFSVIPLSVQISPSWPNPSHSATDSTPFRFRVKIFSRSTLAGEFTGAVIEFRRLWTICVKTCMCFRANVECKSCDSRLVGLSYLSQHRRNAIYVLSMDFS
jgi:hypothetical protein